MKTIIEYTRFFAYSESINKCFYTKFESGVNIVYGKNTSGKSSLIQAINYTFGINDEKHKLSEIIEENVIFRLDFKLIKDLTENITIIRDNEFIYIKRENQPIKKFLGIGGDASVEHKQLKYYLANLVGFNLFLENTNEYKLASLEAMFLPYYVAQDYGWVLALKSFRGLDYFKNFKTDYYDYYLGITNEYDREEKQRLELEKKNYESEIKFLTTIGQKKDELQLSKLKDEVFIRKSSEYIDTYKKDKSELIKKEKGYLILCNEVKYLEERLNITRRIKRATTGKGPFNNDCPTCHQKLPSTIEIMYEYFQDIDDTDSQLIDIKKKIKDKIGAIHSTQKSIEELRHAISSNYSILNNYQVDDLTINTWIDNKANVQLSNMILKQIGEIEIRLQRTVSSLKKFKSDNDVNQERNKKDLIFKGYFNSYLGQLNVKGFNEDYSLYKMKLFPQQGVELLKTLLAYYFSYNKIIKQTVYVHRFPFVMDAIFKEDVDEGNRALILKFIYEHMPNDTQIIFSIAESKENNKTAKEYNKEYLNDEAHLILINKETERAFLSDYKQEFDDIKNETLQLME